MAPNKRLIKSKNNSSSGTATVKGGKIVKRPTENSIKKKIGKAKVKLTTKELPKKNAKKTPNVQIKKAAAKSTSKQENISKATTASNALNKMGTRGKKRSYAELASGTSSKEDYKQVKKQKVSKVRQETTPRGSRNKKPTVKASEWFSTINSKKQGSAKKETIKSSPKNKTPKTKSPKISKIQNSSSKKISSSKAALKTTVKSKTPKKSTKQVVNRKESNSTKKTTQNQNKKITPTKTPSKRKSTSSTPKKLSTSSEVKPKLRKKVTPGKSNQPTKQTIKNVTPPRSTRKQSILQPDNDNKETTQDNVIVAEEILKEMITSVIKPPDFTNLEIAESNSKFNAEKIVVEEKNVSVEQEEQIVKENLEKIVTNELDRGVKDRNIVNADEILDTSKAEDIVQNAKEEVCAITDKESSDCAEENTPVLLNESNGTNVSCSPKNEIDNGLTNSNQVIDSQDGKVLQNKNGINSMKNENQTEAQKTISCGKSHISSKSSDGLKPNPPQNITNGVHETNEVKEQSCLMAEQVILTHKSHTSKIDVSIFNNQTVETKEIDTLAVCNNANEQEQTKTSNNILEKPLIENVSEKASLELSSVEKNQSSSESDILKDLSKINTTNSLSDLHRPTYTKENNLDDDVAGNIIVEKREMKESLDINLKLNQTESLDNTINDDSFTLRLDSSNGAEDNESEEKDGTETASNLELICTSHEKDKNVVDNSVGAKIQDTEQKGDKVLSEGDEVIGEISQPFYKDDAESLSVRETTITEIKTNNTQSECVAELTENPRSCENSKDHNIHIGKKSSESDQVTLVSDTKETEEDDINLVVKEQRLVCDPLSSENLVKQKPDELASLPVTNEVCEDSVPNMDVAEDSPESMTINSETRSSNRMSIDEDNSPMDLDPESALPNGNPACNSQGQIDNEVMEVS